MNILEKLSIKVSNIYCTIHVLTNYQNSFIIRATNNFKEACISFTYLIMFAKNKLSTAQLQKYCYQFILKKDNNLSTHGFTMQVIVNIFTESMA